MARTSLNAVEEINIKEKIFHGKNVANVQEEFDLCGDTSSVHVDVSTARTDVRGAEESSKKMACGGKNPSFFILLCFVLTKRGSKCQFVGFFQKMLRWEIVSIFECWNVFLKKYFNMASQIIGCYFPKNGQMFFYMSLQELQYWICLANIFLA